MKEGASASPGSLSDAPFRFSRLGGLVSPPNRRTQVYLFLLADCHRNLFPGFLQSPLAKPSGILL